MFREFWKILGGGGKNYSFEIGKYLLRVFCDYSAADAYIAIHNRFFNESGRPGESIPLDLKCEHFIRADKTMMKSRFSGLSAEYAKMCSLVVEPLQVCLCSINIFLSYLEIIKHITSFIIFIFRVFSKMQQDNLKLHITVFHTVLRTLV